VSSKRNYYIVSRRVIIKAIIIRGYTSLPVHNYRHTRDTCTNIAIHHSATHCNALQHTATHYNIYIFIYIRVHHCFRQASDSVCTTALTVTVQKNQKNLWTVHNKSENNLETNNKQTNVINLTMLTLVTHTKTHTQTNTQTNTHTRCACVCVCVCVCFCACVRACA